MRLLEAIGQGGEFALRNLGRPELPVQSTKHTKTKHKNLNPTSQDPDTILRNGVAEYKVVGSLPPSCWWTPRRLPLRLRPRQPPPLRQATQRNDQNAQSHRRTEPTQPWSQSNQEPAAAARSEANHRRVATGDVSGEPLQRQAKAGRRAALLAGSGSARRGERESDGTTESSIVERAAAAPESNFDIFRLGSCGFGARGLCISIHPRIVGSASLAATGGNQDLQFQPHCRLSAVQTSPNKISFFLLFVSLPFRNY